MERGNFNQMEGGMERGPESKEREPKETTRVILEVMRHGKREKGATPEADANPDLRLTPEGREQATAKGKTLDPQTEVALALGSSRTRTLETAGRAMLAKEEDILPTDSFEEIEAKIARELSYGKKMIVDDRLGFGDGGPIEASLMEAFKEKRFLPWVINNSDREAIVAGDTVSPTLTRNAGNIAEIVRRYATVGNNFEKLVAQDETNKYAATGNQLERYLGTHQGIAESFVAKALELTKGPDAMDEFVNSVGTGFGEAEGIRIEIINHGGDQEIVMTYTLKDVEKGDRQEKVQFTADLLDQIIAQKQEFESLVRAEKKREDAAYFTRHSAASYNTLGKIKKSDNPRAAVDRENQETPDLTETGAKLAKEKAEIFFSGLNPDSDALFFASSDEARALETANVYRQMAKEKGFQILTPDHVRGSFAEQIGEGEIRTLDTLSLGTDDALLASVFAPDSQLGSPNWDAVDDEFKDKWAKARAIINSHDYGSFGANLFYHSDEIAKIFPEVKTSKELYDIKFKRLVKLAEFGINKAKESGLDKNVKILAFGHENYMGYALDKYFAEHNIGNCETIDLTIDSEGSKFISKKGVTRELEQ